MYKLESIKNKPLLLPVALLGFILTIMSAYIFILIFSGKTPTAQAAVDRSFTADHAAIIGGSGSLKKITQINPGDLHTCASTSDLLVYCSGYNDFGQVGDGTTTWRSTPVHVGSGVTKTSTTQYYSCALTYLQTVFCAGRNNYGQLGDGTTTDRLAAVQFQLPAGKSATSVLTNFYYWSTCVITNDQLVYCAGINDYGQLGDGTTTNRSTPVQFQLPAGKAATAISGKQFHACALTFDRLVYCTGYNGAGALGDGTGTNRSTPVQFQTPAGKVPVSLTTGFYHTCVLTTDQLVYCSGYNVYGQLGDGTFTDIRFVPVQFQLPAGKTALSVKASAYQTCVLTTDRLVYCAGYNLYGQLGDGSTTNRAVPVQFQLPAGKTAAAFDEQYLHTCVLTTDQLVYCSGYNPFGSLGDGSTTDRSTPVQFQLPAGITPVSLSLSSYQSCVITLDQLGYCSGYGPHGQLGNGTTPTSQTTAVKFTLP